MKFVLLSFFIFFQSCVPKGPPCWLTGPCSPYDVDKWLIGVGSGETSMEADQAAISRIAQQFGLKIKMTQTLNSTTSEQNNGGSTTTLSSKSLAEEITTEVDIDLSNIVIVQRHQREGSFFSLAVLEREPLLNQIDSSLEKIDTLLGQKVFEAQQQDSKVESIRKYGQALQLVENAQALNDKRFVVDPEFRKKPVSITDDEVRARQEEIFRMISISANADAGSRELLDAAEGSFAKSLFRIIDMDGDLDLQLTSIESIIPPDPYGFHKVRIKVQFSLYEPRQSQRILMKQELVGEGASQELFKARALAIYELQQEVTGEQDIGLRLRHAILAEEE